METNTKRVKRVPRLLGLTQMIIEYRVRPEIKSNIDQYILNQWYAHAGTICGTSYDINHLISTFDIPKDMVESYIRDVVIKSPIWDRSKQEELINGLLGTQITWAIEDRMEIVSQLNLLKASQGGKYTPFVSAEVNKALKLKLESSTSLQSIIRSLTGGASSVNIFQQFNQENNTNVDNNYITLEDARSIIENSIKVDDKSKEVKYLEAQYDLASLPEVVATKQQGIDTSREGLSINKMELNSITDNYKESLKLSSKEHHEQRREIEQRIDQDSEDPELSIYEEIEEDPEPLPFGSSPYLT